MTHIQTTASEFSSHLSAIPLVAILRGIQTHECAAIASALYEKGLRVIEVPLNSPNALGSIELLANLLPSDCLVGAGTVLEMAQVAQVAQVGGRVIVMPHTDTTIIRAAKQAGLFCVPGVATISEAFSALHYGADALKLFPAESVPPSVLKAWRTVLPKEALCLPVGGVQPDGVQAYLHAGANGFGLGAGLYQPGMDVQQVAVNAQAFINALPRD